MKPRARYPPRAPSSAQTWGLPRSRWVFLSPEPKTLDQAISCVLCSWMMTSICAFSWLPVRFVQGSGSLELLHLHYMLVYIKYVKRKRDT